MNILEIDLTAFLDGFMSEYNIPGYDCSVWHKGREIYRQSKGYSDAENKISYSSNTLLHIYSNTKIIACVAALQLFEKGLFKLEDPISLYFPEMSAMKVKSEDGPILAKREITIRNLFTMTAGIAYGEGHSEAAAEFLKKHENTSLLAELPRFLAMLPLEFHPDEGFFYGICHEVLAALIVKLTGQGFSEYLKEHIFRPLGMCNTAFNPADCVSKELANQYRIEDGKLKNLGNTNILIPPILSESASGGLISTVDDYMKFEEALRKNTLIKRETLDLMRSNKLSAKALEDYGYTDGGLGYGLGVHTVVDKDNPNAVGPFGWGGAAGTLALIDPENDLSVFYAQQFFGSRDIQGNHELKKIVYSSLGIK